MSKPVTSAGNGSMPQLSANKMLYAAPLRWKEVECLSIRERAYADSLFAYRMQIFSLPQVAFLKSLKQILPNTRTDGTEASR